MRNYKTWWWMAVVLQLLTAAFHALSLLNEPVAANDTEKQLIDLMQNYRQNLAGMEITMEGLFTALSSCFSLLYLFAGLVNAYLLRRCSDESLLNGILWINLPIFGVCFAIMAVFTFPPPIIMTGLVFILLALAKVTRKP
ncbi:MAG: LIC_13387 family protein [Saprospiraceae bacterium]